MIYRIVLGAAFLMSPMPQVQQEYLIGVGIAVGVSVLAIILITIKLLGAIALIRRSGLGMARTSAILSCFPCACCLLGLPIGIWACILTFSSDAERHFS
jgi:hypothetical protein